MSFPVAIGPLADRVKLWLSHNRGRQYLDRNPKAHLQRELKKWVDRRFDYLQGAKVNHLQVMAFEKGYLEKTRDLYERVKAKNENPPAREDFAAFLDNRREYHEARDLRRQNSEREAAEVQFELDTATYLWESLSEVHGLEWEMPTETWKGPDQDHFSQVIGALRALGQPGMSDRLLRDITKSDELGWMREEIFKYQDEHKKLVQELQELLAERESGLEQTAEDGADS